MLIDPAKIDNARILDAVMALLVPALNTLGERVTALEGKLKSSQGLDSVPTPVKIHAAPTPVVAPTPTAPPPAPVAVEEDEDEELDTPISLPPALKPAGIRRIRSK